MSNEASRVVVELVAKMQQYAADMRSALATHKEATSGMAAASADAEVKVTAASLRAAAAVKRAAAEEAAASENVNYLLRDRADLQARLAALSGTLSQAEKTALRDQALQLKLISDYRRAGLTEQQASIRAEEQLATITATRAKEEARAALGQTAEARAAALEYDKKFAEKFSEGFGLRRTGGGTAAIAGLAAAAGVEVIKSQIEDAIKFGAALENTAKQVGVTTHDLQVYQAAALQAGVTQEQLSSALGDFNNKLGRAQEGAPEMTKIFKDLHVDIGNANVGFKTAGELLPTLIQRISQIASPAQRAAVETALFGESGRKLDAMLSGGPEKIAQLAQALERTGAILGEGDIKTLDKTAIALEKVKHQLEVDVSRTVAENAVAIEGLAQSFLHAAEAALKFFSSFDKKANLSLGFDNALKVDFSEFPAIIKQRLAGKSKADIQSDALSRAIADPAQRSELLGRTDTAIRALNNAGRASSITGEDGERIGGLNRQALDGLFIPGLKDIDDTPQARYQAFVQVRGLRARIKAANSADASGKETTPAAQAGSPGDLSDLFAHKPKGKSAEKLEDERLQREKQFGDQLAQAQEAQLRAQEQMTGDINKQADIEKELVDRALAKRIADIKEQEKLNINKGADPKLEAARAAELQAAATLAATDEKAVIDRKRQIALNDAITASLQTTLGIEADLLNGRLALAQTAKERLKIELELLDNARKQKEVDLNKVINNPLASPGEKADAKARLEALPGQTAVEKKDVQQRNLGPLAAYLKSLPDTADKLDEALQGAAANGLQNLNDGLTTAIGHFLHLHGLAGQFLEDLIKIGLEREVIAPIANFLFPGAASAAGAAGGGGIFSAIAGLFGGTRAAGGSVVAGVPYWVGENGPERFVPPQSGSILPAGHVAAGGGGGGSGGVVEHRIVVLPTPLFDAHVDSRVISGIVQVAPTIVQGAKSATMIAAARPPLPRSAG